MGSLLDMVICEVNCNSRIGDIINLTVLLHNQITCALATAGCFCSAMTSGGRDRYGSKSARHWYRWSSHVLTMLPHRWRHIPVPPESYTELEFLRSPIDSQAGRWQLDEDSAGGRVE